MTGASAGGSSTVTGPATAGTAATIDARPTTTTATIIAVSDRRAGLGILDTVANGIWPPTGLWRGLGIQFTRWAAALASASFLACISARSARIVVA